MFLGEQIPKGLKARSIANRNYAEIGVL